MLEQNVREATKSKSVAPDVRGTTQYLIPRATLSCRELVVDDELYPHYVDPMRHPARYTVELNHGRLLVRPTKSASARA